MIEILAINNGGSIFVGRVPAWCDAFENVFKEAPTGGSLKPFTPSFFCSRSSRTVCGCRMPAGGKLRSHSSSPAAKAEIGAFPARKSTIDPGPNPDAAALRRSSPRSFLGISVNFQALGEAEQRRGLDAPHCVGRGPRLADGTACCSARGGNFGRLHQGLVRLRPVLDGPAAGPAPQALDQFVLNIDLKGIDATRPVGNLSDKVFSRTYGVPLQVWTVQHARHQMADNRDQRGMKRAVPGSRGKGRNAGRFDFAVECRVPGSEPNNACSEAAGLAWTAATAVSSLGPRTKCSK